MAVGTAAAAALRAEARVRLRTAGTGTFWIDAWGDPLRSILAPCDHNLADIYGTRDRIDDRGGDIGGIHEAGTRLRPEGSVHPARRHRDDARLRPFRLGFQRLAVTARAPLRRAVDTLVGLSEERGGGEDVDDRAAVLLESREEQLAEVDRGDEVGVDDRDDGVIVV